MSATVPKLICAMSAAVPSVPQEIPSLPVTPLSFLRAMWEVSRVAAARYEPDLVVRQYQINGKRKCWH